MPLKAAIDVQQFGADGVTIHPRPDERHIRRQDVRDIQPVIKTEFNIEGYPSRSFIDLVVSIKPHQVTLVPDAPDAITSNAGWDTLKHLSFLQDVIAELKEAEIRTSIFVDTRPKLIEGAVEIGTDRIELYTEPYAVGFVKNPKTAVAPFVIAANLANKLGLKVNAGHDLNLQNLKFFNENIPFLKEVSIGHALISDALYMGLEKTIMMYKSKLVK